MELGPNQTRWVEALESGRYKQVDKRLRVGNSFCCLGVVCDLYDQSLWGGCGDEYYFYSGQSKELSNEVTDWIGLRENDGTPWLEKARERNKELTSLINMNDSGMSFADIAKVLREHPDLYFEESK